MIILPESIQDSHKAIENLESLLALAQREKKERSEQVSYLKTQNLIFREKNAKLLQKLFGTSSEKLKVLATNQYQQEAFEFPNQEKLEQQLSARELEPASKITVPAHTRHSSKTKLSGVLNNGDKFPEHLPREQAETIDPGPEAGEILFTKTTETLCVKPSQLFVRVTSRVVRKSESGKITQPPVPETPLARCCVDASFLVHVIVMKFMWHLPLYRQEQMLRSQGIKISRDTLIRYVISVASLLGKLYDELLKQVFISERLFADETPVIVQKSKEYSESRFWPFMGDDSIVFIFAKTRSAKEIEPILSAFKGFLQVDGYTVYESLSQKYPEIVLVFCWAHARRKFIEAQKHYPLEATEALRYLQALYRLEKFGKDNPEKLFYLRRRHAVKILALFKVWLTKKLHDPKTLPKSLIAEAIMYTLTRWDGLQRYCTNPTLSIDSNPIERQIRPIAIGRKNWLFCASETGAEAACLLYSFISTCKLQEIDPSEYLTDVLNRINDHNQLKLSGLLPHNWKKEKYQTTTQQNSQPNNSS